MMGWKLPAFGVFLAWGLWSFVPKITVRYIDPRSAAVYEALGALVVALGLCFSLQFRLQTQPTGVVLALLTGFLGLLGALSFLVAVNRGPVSLVTILSALYPVLTVSFAVVFLGETITLRQGCGMALALISMVLIVG
jgi:bacterial/archaeal transporter family protein